MNDDFRGDPCQPEKSSIPKVGKIKNGATEREFELDFHPGDAVMIALVSRQIL